MPIRTVQSAEEFVTEIEKDIAYLETEFKYIPRLTDRERGLWAHTIEPYNSLHIDSSLPGYTHARHLRLSLIGWLNRIFHSQPANPESSRRILETATRTLQTVKKCLALQQGGEEDSWHSSDYFEIQDMKMKHVGKRRSGGAWTQAAALEQYAYGQNALEPAVLEDCLRKGEGRVMMKENHGYMLGYYVYSKDTESLHINHAALMPSYLTSGVRAIMAVDIVHQTIKEEKMLRRAIMLENRQKLVNPES